MGPLAFLLVAVVLSVAGLLVLWARHREPDTAESSIEEFERTRQALSVRREAARDRPQGDHGEG
jgi:CHASE3 domain sensor protein